MRRDDAACGSAAAAMSTLWAGNQCKAAQLLPILLNDAAEKQQGVRRPCGQAAPVVLVATPAVDESAKRAYASIKLGCVVKVQQRCVVRRPRSLAHYNAIRTF